MGLAATDAPRSAVGCPPVPSLGNTSGPEVADALTAAETTAARDDDFKYGS